MEFICLLVRWIFNLQIPDVDLLWRKNGMRVDSLTGDTYLKSIWDPPKEVPVVKVEEGGEEEEMEDMEEEEEIVIFLIFKKYYLLFVQAYGVKVFQKRLKVSFTEA